MRPRSAIWLLLTGASCSSPASFACDDDDQCLAAGAAGSCEPTGYCSFPDSECVSGRKYGDNAGEFAGDCVPDDGTTSAPGSTSATSGGSTTTSTTGQATTGTGSSTTVADTGPQGAPDGSPCSDPVECANTCFVIPLLGGVCGPCAGDADCPGGGCNVPVPQLDIPSSCHPGAEGGTCESNRACGPGLVCATVFSIGGLELTGCSECMSDADCPAGARCTPDLEISSLRGDLECVAPGTLLDGETCSVGSPDVCVSGNCAPVDVMGVGQFGMCSVCDTNADCAVGGCVFPVLDVATLEVAAGFCG